MNSTSREHRSKAQVLGASDKPVRVTIDAFSKVREVEVPVRAELDRRGITVRELLALSVGDLLPLSRPVGENIDLIAGDTLLGNAEILAMDEKLAVRVADISNKQPSSNTVGQQQTKALEAHQSDPVGLTPDATR